MGNDDSLKKAYEALDEKYKELQAAEEEMAASYEELQAAEEELNLQNEELRNTKDALQQNEILLKESQRVARLGHYVFNITLCYWESSETLDEIFGIDKYYTRDVDGWIQIIHPSHQKEMLDYLTNHVIGKKQSFDKEYRIVGVLDNQERWVYGRGNLKFDTQGNPIEMFGIIQDITARKLAEEALKESNERLRFALEGTNDGLWDVQMKTGSVYISPRGCEILGYGLEGLDEVVKVWSDLVHPDDLPLTNKHLQAHLEGKTPIFEVEQRLRTKSGDWKWIHTRGKLVARDQDGSPLRITGTHTDITDRKRAQLAFTHSHNLMSYIIEHNRSSVAVLDKELRYIYISQRYLNEHKAKESNVIGKLHYDIFPNLPQHWKDAHQKALQGEVVNAEEDLICREDGTIDWTRWECRPWYDADGSIGGIIIYSEVITKQKQQELLIKEKSEEINTFFDSAIDLLCIADINGYFLRLNKEWENVLGYALEEIQGKKFFDFVHPEDLEATLGVIDQLSDQIKTLNFTNRYRSKDGTYKWIEWKSYPKGNRIYAAARDITERIQQGAELIAAKERAEESDRLKTAFLQNMSHEIRTPMNAIMGFSELLVHNYNNKPKLEFFSEIINQRCNDLLDIINDLLDISRIESGQMRMNVERCHLNKLFAELNRFFTEHQKRLKNSQVTLQLMSPGGADVDIFTDSGKLKQIFINLIGNAFKFTSKGRIEAGYRMDSNPFVTFYVSDTGIGIQRDKQQMIFERFVQVEQGPNRQYGGTGLGLSIVKGLVGLLGGEIWLDSEPGKGTTFYFTIPINVYDIPEKAQPVAQVTAETYRFQNKTILVVEDDQFNTEYIKEILSGRGLHILNAALGTEAIQLAASHAPDLVLMDIRLPDMNGYEATRKIRQHNPGVKIIAQTAYAGYEDNLKAMEAGCVDYISKPLKRDQLLVLIGKHLSQNN